MPVEATPAKAKTPTMSQHEFDGMCEQFSPAGLLQRKIRRNALTGWWQIALSVSACGKRLSDVMVASLLLIVLSPFLIPLVLALALDGRPLLTSTLVVGRWGVPFRLFELNTKRKFGGLLRRLRLHRFPVLIHVLRGEMSLVGPRPVDPKEMDLRQQAARQRSGVRPGLVSLWWLRQNANINFGTELDIDLEYINHQTTKGDFGIALRAIPSLLYGVSAATAPDRVDILGIRVDNFTMDEALQFILDSAVGSAARQLCFVNTDCINKSVREEKYRNLLHKSDAVLADGIGIRIAGKITRREIRQNVNGTDLFPLLCQRLQRSELGLFLLGARPEVVGAIAEWVNKTHPGVRIKGYRDGYFDATQEAAVLQEIDDSGAEILLVAFGSPRQDLWIAEHLPQLAQVRIAMGVGGLFDFYSGRIPRAPQWMRELSLEWVYRLYQEPGRMWRRYLLGNVVFLSRVVIGAVFRKSSNTKNVHA